MNFWIQLFIIFLVAYYLFYHNDHNSKKIVEKYKRLGSMGGGTIRGSFKGSGGRGFSGIGTSLWTPNYYSQYRLNSYNLNDLSQSQAKRYYPLDFPDKLDKKKVKYLKAINESLGMIGALVNKNKETTYNVQDRNPTPIENNPKTFNFVSSYLESKLNELSRNLYTVKFEKFINVSGEEVDEQYNVYMDMQFSVVIKKESYSDTKPTHIFIVKANAIINKPDIRLNKKGTIFFRSMFVDDKFVNDYMTYNTYRDWGN
jgi:hypothetical protein